MTHQLVTAAAIRDGILEARPGTPIWCEQTGGGTATIYAGVPMEPAPHRYPVAIGPGSYDWGDPWQSTFELSETAVGPDDDGASVPVYPVTLRGIVRTAATLIAGGPTR